MSHNENKEEIRKCLQKNDEEKKVLQNLQDAAKAFLRGKFIAMQAFLKKQEKSEINNLTYHLKELEKEAQSDHKVGNNEDQRGNK